jgi:hypothetical protein
MRLWQTLFGHKADVTFLREETRQAAPPFRDLATYRYYKAGNTETALEFLNKQKVDQNLFYICVETQEGRWVKDCTGIYDS